MALNLDFVEKMPWSQKLIILIGIIGLLVGLYVPFIYIPLQDDLKEAHGKLDEKMEEIRRLDSRKEDLDLIKSRIDALQDEIKEQRKALPDDEEISKIFHKLDSLGKKNGIEFSRITRGNKSSVGNVAQKVPISLDYTGNYKYVMRFFYEIVNIERIIKVSNIKLKGGKGKGGSSRIAVSCEATTFMSK